MLSLAKEIQDEDPTFEYNENNVELKIFEWYNGKNKYGFNMDEIVETLNEKGYVVIENVLNETEIENAKNQLYDWQKTIHNHDKLHNVIDPHGIYKFHNVGHTRFAWELRINEKIQSIYKYLWKTNELVVGFDGACFIEKNCNKKDNIWTHTDQAPNKNTKCYQGFVALTSNKERTLVVYEGSHKYHEKYFQTYGTKNEKSNWQLINHKVLENMKNKKKVLNVSAGSLVLWDSRTFHQNQYGKPKSEERIVQYLCYLPKNNVLNSENMKKKRRKYYDERRTTSHWPYPIKVNPLQPQTFGDNSRLIDYNTLVQTNLFDIQNQIDKLL